MIKQQFRILLSGHVLEGFDPQQVSISLAHLLNINEQQAERILNQQEIQLNKSFDREHVQRAYKKIMSMGIDCKIILVRESPVMSKTVHESAKEYMDARASSVENLKKQNTTEKSYANLSFQAVPPFVKKFIDKHSLAVVITCICLFFIAIRTYIFYMMLDQRNFDIFLSKLFVASTMPISIIIPIAIIWALLNSFHIGWIIAIVYLSYNLYDVLSYYIASYGTSWEQIIVLLLLSLAFLALLQLSVLRRLSLPFVDHCIEKLPLLLCKAFPVCIILVILLIANNSENKTFTTQAGRLVTYGILQAQTATIDFIYGAWNQDSEWPVGKVLPLPNNKVIASAVFGADHSLNIRYVDNPLLHNAYLNMTFSEQGRLIQCSTDTIPSRMVAPNCEGCVCNASSSTMERQ